MARRQGGFAVAGPFADWPYDQGSNQARSPKPGGLVTFLNGSGKKHLRQPRGAGRLTSFALFSRRRVPGRLWARPIGPRRTIGFGARQRGLEVLLRGSRRHGDPARDSISLLRAQTASLLRQADGGTRIGRRGGTTMVDWPHDSRFQGNVERRAHGYRSGRALTP